jgi:hypothetical protein
MLEVGLPQFRGGEDTHRSFFPVFAPLWWLEGGLSLNAANACDGLRLALAAKDAQRIW